MAQVERSTSSGGKRYLTSKAVVFDDVEAKNIIVGGKDNTSGLIQVLDETGTLSVNIDKDGVTLSNGAELIGGNGLKSTLLIQGVSRSMKFYTSGDYAPVGIDLLYASTSDGGTTYDGVYGKSNMIFDFIVPTTFTVTSAIITLSHIPIKNYYTGILANTGYSRNLQLYKGSSFTGMYKKFDYDFPTVVEEAGITFNVVTNALGASGFNGNDTTMTSVPSIDITSQLTTGTNIFKIETGDSLPTISGTYVQCTEGASIRTGACLGLLTITGFTQ